MNYRPYFVFSYLTSIKGTDGIVAFLKMFNNGFDVFNCDTDTEDNVYKTPINTKNKEIIMGVRRI